MGSHTLSNSAKYFCKAGCANWLSQGARNFHTPCEMIFGISVGCAKYYVFFVFPPLEFF